MSAQLHNVLELLLVKNQIRLAPNELKLQLSSHPSYPSLHSITGVLQHFGVSNLAIKLPTTNEILDELPTTFIAHIIKDDNESLVLIEKLKTKIKITSDTNKIEKLSRMEFLNIWDGIIVAIEKDKQINDVSRSPIKNALNWFLISLSVLFTTYLLFSLTDTFSQFHFSLSLIGLFLSVFIVQHELGISSTVVNNLCNISSETSCEASFQSKGSKIFNAIKLSDVCIVTFSSFLLYWLLFFNNAFLSYKTILLCSILALPFTFYSLYYQFKIVKKWCPLCLGIIGVLWLQSLAILIANFSFGVDSDDWTSLILLAVSGISSIGIWNLLKQALERKLVLEKSEINHFKFKRNFALFNTLYQNEKNLSVPKNSIKGEIVLGNKNAPLELVLVTSPLCYYCKQAHKDIMRILQSAESQIKVIIRFNVGLQNKDSLLYKINSTLLHIYNTQNQIKCKQALDAVFSQEADLNSWLAKYKDESISGYDSILQKQQTWCLDNKINFTPALFVDGKQFPKEYDRPDLLFFIEELIEELEIDDLLKNELNVAN